jgi:nucleoside phosphorylase
MRAEMDRYESVLTTETTLAHRPLFSGTLGGRPVSVLNTGMGLTNTAIALLAALDALDPCAVLSQGTAGAHAEDLRVGDIVCANAFVYGDSRKGDGAVDNLNALALARRASRPWKSSIELRG